MNYEWIDTRKEHPQPGQQVLVGIPVPAPRMGKDQNNYFLLDYYVARF